jgi:hypothetical protein
MSANRKDSHLLAKACGAMWHLMLVKHGCLPAYIGAGRCPCMSDMSDASLLLPTTLHDHLSLVSPQAVAAFAWLSQGRAPL